MIIDILKAERGGGEGRKEEEEEEEEEDDDDLHDLWPLKWLLDGYNCEAEAGHLLVFVARKEENLLMCWMKGS